MELESYGEEEFFELGEREPAPEPEPMLEAEELPEAAHEHTGIEALLDARGGEGEDWTLESRGDSGYSFDGEHVRGPDGEIWVNEDAVLHQEMLALWREGEGTSFFLPDYRERTEAGENLYVTQLILAKDGAVSYEIYKHEIVHGVREDEALEPRVDTEMRVAGESSLEALPYEPEEEHGAQAESQEMELSAEAQEVAHERESVPHSVEILRALGMPLMHSFGLGSFDEPEREREPTRASRGGIIMETSA